MALLSEPAPARWTLGWRGLAAGFIAFGIAVLIAIWAPISPYGRHLQEQSAAALAQGTAVEYMPSILTEIPAVREFLSLIVPFFRDAAGHEWVRHPWPDNRSRDQGEHASLTRMVPSPFIPGLKPTVVRLLQFDSVIHCS